MSKQFFNFAAAWFSRKSDDVISCKINPEMNGGFRIFVQNEAGEQMELESFFLKRTPSQRKDGSPMPENAPDFNCTFVVEEE